MVLQFRRSECPKSAQNNNHGMPRAIQRAIAVSKPFLSSRAITMDPTMMAITPNAMVIQRSRQTLSPCFNPEDGTMLRPNTQRRLC
jgi:hypothetical protein